MSGLSCDTRANAIGSMHYCESTFPPMMPTVMLPEPETWTAPDATPVTIRAIRAADFGLEKEFVEGLSSATGYQRLMSTRRPSADEIRRFTDIDYEREMALIATVAVKGHEQGRERQVGVARYVKDEGARGEAEFAIVLADDWQGRGLGRKLLTSLLAAAKSQGVRRLVGTALSSNEGMLALARRTGFRLARDPASATIMNLTLDLAP
jgi:RimJ/RimL family protein N-acetyltransferase